MSLSNGTRLGPYEILDAIGAGGMGEVYKARDTRLDRTVAIKVLPANIADRADLRQRLEREARAVSSLNHPHICVLHDIGQQDGIDFLVMEYLEGETLAARLTKGPLALDQALRYAIQIADALALAHKQGVFHRDLKPGNIMLTKAGAKLLDFGLAKLRQSAAAGTLSQIPTELGDLTQKGTILGTFQYMSPEQLEGKDTDARADIFAFGAVLYEMVTGRKAFQGSSHASLIAAIMHTQPAPVSALAPLTPAALDHLVQKCLAKDPDERWQNAADLAGQLKWIAQSTAAPATPIPGQSAAMSAVSAAAIPTPAAPGRGITLALGVAAAVLLVSTVVLALIHFRESPAEVHPVRFPIYLPPKATLQTPDLPVISPDGRQLVFSGVAGDGKRMLWLRSLDSLAVQPLAGTDGGYFPFWSPDSRYLAFCTTVDLKLKRIDISGGPPQAICDISQGGGGGTWNRDGVILFRRTQGPLYRVSAAGGEPKPALELDQSRKEIGHYWPAFLPDGRHFLYSVLSNSLNQTGIYLGSLDSKETHLVLQGASNVRYAPPGFLLFGRQEALLAQPFDLKKLQLTGEPFPVAEQVGRMGTFAALSLFSVSDNGALAYRSSGSSELQLAWYNRDGKRLQAAGEKGIYRQIVLSPDEKRLAIERLDPKGGLADVWLLELTSGILSRVTFDPGTDGDPVWSPDGREVVFQSNRSGRNDLFRKVIGGGNEEMIFQSGEAKFPEQWLKDGSIIFLTLNGKVFYRLPGPGGERKPEVLLKNDFNKDEPHVSPDGRWIVYNSDESGRWEVYLAAFPSFTEKRQVSNGGGVQAIWRKDGKELFYLTLDGKLMAVDVKGGAVIETGQPKLLFQTSIRVAPTIDQYCVTGDGKRFLFGEPVEEGEKPMTVVLNWPAAIRR
jgi:Tol biopolymer transport system component